MNCYEKRLIKGHGTDFIFLFSKLSINSSYRPGGQRRVCVKNGIHRSADSLHTKSESKIIEDVKFSPEQIRWNEEEQPKIFLPNHSGMYQSLGYGIISILLCSLYVRYLSLSVLIVCMYDVYSCHFLWCLVYILVCVIGMYACILVTGIYDSKSFVSMCQWYVCPLSEVCNVLIYNVTGMYPYLIDSIQHLSVSRCVMYFNVLRGILIRPGISTVLMLIWPLVM